MKLYSEDKNYKLYHGNMLDMLNVIEPNSIDSIVTDPPYELGFMGKSWDKSGIAFQQEAWEKCLKVLKPGGYLLAFGAPRNYHRLACAIEDAGFEIRDSIFWCFGSGFPKSMNIGLAIDKKLGNEPIDTGIKSPNARPNSNKTNTLYESGTVGKDFTIKKANNEWEGWGSCLKPAYEPIIVARKPLEGTLVDNVLTWGVGGINIEECRVPTDGRTVPINAEEIEIKENGTHMDSLHKNQQHERVETSIGRFPSNTILSYTEDDYDEVCGGFPNTKGTKVKEKGSYGFCFSDKKRDSKPMADGYNDSGSAARYFMNFPIDNEDYQDLRRYFYSAKASKRDRDEGLEDFAETTDKAKGNGLGRVCEFCGAPQLKPELCTCKVKSWILPPKKNTHPTVKPHNLMQYLVKLVTPKGGVILDPFNGSGSTGKAVMLENIERDANYKYIGIELTEEYLPIAKARIEYAKTKKQVVEKKPKKAKEKKGNKLF